MNPVVCQDVHLSYGSYQAVRGADLEVNPGELVALLGTNGAGKSTLLDVLLGLRRPDSGTVRVLGLDPHRSRRRLAPEIGVVLQESGCAPDLTVAETVRLWLRLHRRLPASHAEALLDEVRLEHRAGLRVRRLSGGERRRLDLAVALCGDPQLLLLDEPTAGLDPQARAHTWALLRRRLQRGITVLLTTHYLEEAETLADRVVVLDEGVIMTAEAGRWVAVRTAPSRPAASLTTPANPLTKAIVRTAPSPPATTLLATALDPPTAVTTAPSPPTTASLTTAPNPPTTAAATTAPNPPTTTGLTTAPSSPMTAGIKVAEAWR